MRFRAAADGVTLILPTGEVIHCPPGTIVEGVLCRTAPPARSPATSKMLREREDKMLDAERGDYEDKALA